MIDSASLTNQILLFVMKVAVVLGRAAHRQRGPGRQPPPARVSDVRGRIMHKRLCYKLAQGSSAARVACEACGEKESERANENEYESRRERRRASVLNRGRGRRLGRRLGLLFLLGDSASFSLALLGSSTAWMLGSTPPDAIEEERWSRRPAAC